MRITNLVKCLENITVYSLMAFDPFKQGLASFSEKDQIVNIFSFMGRRSLLQLLHSVTIVKKQSWSIFKQMDMGRIGLDLICQTVKSLNTDGLEGQKH